MMLSLLLEPLAADSDATGKTVVLALMIWALIWVVFRNHSSDKPTSQIPPKNSTQTQPRHRNQQPSRKRQLVNKGSFLDDGLPVYSPLGITHYSGFRGFSFDKASVDEWVHVLRKIEGQDRVDLLKCIAKQLPSNLSCKDAIRLLGNLHELQRFDAILAIEPKMASRLDQDIFDRIFDDMSEPLRAAARSVVYSK